MEQILSEAAGADFDGEVSRGRGDDADIDLDVLVAADAAETLLDLAQVQEGDLPTDATAFARRVTTLLAGSLG